MKRITFALYPVMPVACEGNDDPRHIRVVRISARANEHIALRAQKVADWLSRRLDCYAQVWDITKV